MVVQEKDIKRILEACHSDSLSGGHFGRDKTYQKIAERYYWIGLRKTVETFISSCDMCQKVNRKLPGIAPALHPVPVPQKVWSQVGLDLVGPLPETAAKNKYIAGFTDYFSKWTEAVAIQSKSAADVADALMKVVCRLGVMETLIIIIIIIIAFISIE